jgi:hypothetical protein
MTQRLDNEDAHSDTEEKRACVEQRHPVRLEALPRRLRGPQNTELSCEAPSAGFVSFNSLFGGAAPLQETDGRRSRHSTLRHPVRHRTVR